MFLVQAVGSVFLVFAAVSVCVSAICCCLSVCLRVFASITVSSDDCCSDYDSGTDAISRDTLDKSSNGKGKGTTSTGAGGVFSLAMPAIIHKYSKKTNMSWLTRDSANSTE